MAVKSFTTAAKHETPDEEQAKPVTVDIDGREVTFAGPTGKTMLMLMSIYAELDSGNQMLALGSAVNLVYNLLEGEDRAHMRRRLFDPKDPYDQEDFASLFRYLMEEWTGRPTDPPSDSDSQQSVSGRSSTETSPSGVSIPASFGRTGS